MDRCNRPRGRRRWRIAWLLGLGVLVSYFDRVNLTVSHAALYTAFGISDITFGYLSAAYNWTYALCQLPIGVLLDRFGVRRIGRIGTFIWSIASFAAAVTPNIGGFFAARLLLGVGESPTFPANAKATGYWFPTHERSFATAIFDSAAKFSSALGVPVIGLVLLSLGWRWSFAMTGLLSLLYFALFSKTYRDPADDPKLTETEREYIQAGDVPADAARSYTARSDTVEGAQSERSEDRAVPLPLATLLSQPKVLGLALGFGSYNYVFYLLLTWLPSYLSFALHIDLVHSFLYTGIPWLIATVTDLAGGWCTDILVQRGWDAARVRQIVLVCGTAAGLGVLGAAHAHTATRALVWISISIGGLSAVAPVGWSVPSLIVPRSSVGTVGGIVNFSNQISGIAAPIATGYVVATTHSYAWAFGIAAIYLLIGIASYIFLLGRIEPIDVKPGPVIA
jgi:ACS family D-galactonate transporter-like MFS transporter